MVLITMLVCGVIAVTVVLPILTFMRVNNIGYEIDELKRLVSNNRISPAGKTPVVLVKQTLAPNETPVVTEKQTLAPNETPVFTEKQVLATAVTPDEQKIESPMLGQQRSCSLNTSVPSARPLIMRFRAGKNAGRGLVPGSYSEITTPPPSTRSSAR